MLVQDLGQIDGPVLIFGGPYSNLPATEALIRRARQMQIPPGQMICTGDVVAYCAEPAQTAAAIRDLGCAVVAGNCEKQLAAGAPDCGCGFDEGSACDLLSAGWFAHADAAIGADDRAWMAALPDIVTFTHQGRRVAVLHGGLTDISRFIWSVSDEAVFAEELARLTALTGPVDRVFAGHSGIPFDRSIGTVSWTNAGVIGMPPHDGAPDTRYVVLQDDDVQIHKLCYDHDAAIAGMQAVGLTQGYDAGLISGYWPSEEVLPLVLRREDVAKG